MIITNGTLQALFSSAPKQNEWGEVEESEERRGDAVPCQWLLPSANEQARFQTERAPSFSYVVLTEKRHFQRADRYRLSDSNGDTIGDFPVHRVEHLDAVQQVRLFF